MRAPRLLTRRSRGVLAILPFQGQLAIMDYVYEYYSFYVRAAVRFWHTIGPYEYGGLLLLIGIIGWLLMKGNAR